MASAGNSRSAVERVWRQALHNPRTALEQGLDPSELTTLLLDVVRNRAAIVTPARLVQRWREDRYVQPVASDPRRVWRVESRLWDVLSEEFTGIELSPVAPLGTCSSVATVNQNRIISTMRGSEVVSDATNVLALEAAARRKKNPALPVNLAACVRVLRAQPFAGEGLFQHFRTFALLSSGRDRGSCLTEAEMLSAHLRFWLHAVSTIAPQFTVRAEFSAFDSPTVLERFRDTVSPNLQLADNATLVEEPSRQRGRGYYTSGALRVTFADHPSIGEIGDGGFTDWTAKLMADSKERCLISCIATERVTDAATEPLN